MIEPSPHNVMTTLTAIIRKVSPGGHKAAITEATRLTQDLGLDSVASLELLSMIDEELGLFLEMEDVVGIETVGGIFALTMRRLQTLELSA